MEEVKSPSSFIVKDRADFSSALPENENGCSCSLNGESFTVIQAN
jgi:hypothetical protein